MISSITEALAEIKENIQQTGSDNRNINQNRDLLVKLTTWLESIAGAGALSNDYKLVAGVIRNTGSGWFIINDIDHEPLNLTGISETSQAITIEHNVGAAQVVSMVAVPDETYANRYNFGTSVGLNSTSIKIVPNGAVMYADITHTGNGVFTISSNTGGLSYNYNPVNGLFTLTSTFQAKGIVKADNWRGNTHIMGGSNSLNYNNIYRKFYNLDGTQQTLINPEVERFTIERKLDVVNVIDPNDLTDAAGNIWVFGLLKMT